MNVAVSKAGFTGQSIQRKNRVSLCISMEEQIQSLHIRTYNTCCSNGYSNKIIPYGMLPSGRSAAKLRRLVHMWVDDMLEQNIHNFLCPMEPGIDLMVAERVIAYRNISKEPIKLIACLTHPGIQKEISLLFRDTFASLCKQADHILYNNEIHGGRRIRSTVQSLMVKHSSHILVAYSGAHLPMILQEPKSKSIQRTCIQTDLQN